VGADEAALSVIYLIVEPDSIFPEDTRATALLASGVEIASYVYLDADLARKRLANAAGLYRRHCPEGYRLVWAAGDDPGCQEALRRKRELWEAGRAAREEAARAIAEQARSGRQAPAAWASAEDAAILEAIGGNGTTGEGADDEDEGD
jgi:hypothetical protein